ncbi:unnamed protein product [Cochlearia groenlandica]
MYQKNPMEEQRDESDIREPMEESGQILSLSSQTQALAEKRETLSSAAKDKHDHEKRETLSASAGKKLGLSPQTQTLDSEVYVLSCIEDGNNKVKLSDSCACDAEEDVFIEKRETLYVAQAKHVQEKGEKVCVSYREAMDIDYAVEEHVEKDVTLLDNNGNESEIASGLFLDSRKSLALLQDSQELIPIDLITEIFSRLPAKSVARFRCLSKQWRCVLSGTDFIELFRARSRARPRLMFAVERNCVWSFYSSPQSQCLYHKPSPSSPLVVAADFHTKFSQDVNRYICSYASGLFYFPDMWIPREGRYSRPVICNPLTGHYKSLPEVTIYRKSRGFLGYDPIVKRFKVLTEAYPFCSQRDHHSILTLEDGEQSWMSKRDSPSYNQCTSESLCISGVIYYLADDAGELSRVIVSFHVLSEEFKCIDVECFGDSNTVKLINYKGKVGGIDCKYVKVDEKRTLELCIWVLEDAEKEEWSKHVYTLWEDESFNFVRKRVSVVGVTSTGLIVLSNDYTSTPFCVFYFDPERNTLQRVEIQGFGDGLEEVESCGRVYVYLDHVEDRFDDPRRKRGKKHEHQKGILGRRKPQEEEEEGETDRHNVSVSLLEPAIVMTYD